MEYDQMCVETFLKNQEKLFDEPVAQTSQEARDFLEDCMAQVFPGFREMKRYFKENLDASGMSDEEIREACEVFELPDGRFLVVEG